MGWSNASPLWRFRMLKTLIVDGCQFLSLVIPLHLLRFLSNLEGLQVQNCNYVKTIFDVRSTSLPFSLSLRTLTLKELPDLKHIWNEDSQEIPSFKFLQQVSVDGCRSIKSLFPISLVQGKLESLEKLRVRNCHGLVEIVAKDETISGGATNSVMFPSLMILELLELPQLKCIYPGLHNLEWPKLEVLEVYHCGQLKLFSTEGQDHCQDHFLIDMEDIVSFEKVFPKLEQLSLNKENIAKMEQRQFQANFLRRVKFLVLLCFHDDSGGFPCEFFKSKSIPNMEKLRVGCSNFKAIFTSHRPNVDQHTQTFFSQLKEIQLDSLPKLKSIGLEQSWVAPVLENLETLRMRNCPCLMNLVTSTASFSKLRELHVSNCQGLVYLITPSTARSLVLLEELSIDRCGSIQEIVAKEDESNEDEITFSKLKRFFLNTLQRLGSFHAGNCTFNFPSLELVTVHQCPRMRIFSGGTINASRHVRVSAKLAEYRNLPLECCGMDLNVSIKLIFSSQLENFARHAQHLELGDNPELEDIWHGIIPVPYRGLTNLKTLTLWNCHSLTHAIPSHLVPSLCSLESLEVQNCNSLTAIFDVGPASTPFSFSLETLTLKQLPNMENVWNGDATEIISFQCLLQVDVAGCSSLNSLFPASMAQGKLESLQELRVKNCERLIEIIAEYETGGATSNLIMFPSLTILKLHTLPELKCIHPTLNNLEWPKLEKLFIYHCGKLNNFPIVGQDHFTINVEAATMLRKFSPT
ncbi:uncharacterized protein LOC129287958 isoform X2 [Prosopis cineraria]|uniref:uncharacterized protein LOC129287958 isoform X2 n=1 Tax=Prosopis cineraria TaxID=364024 RepID=UPI00240ED448|nr:uncharacterized protein LOC129287958 isoform X2 [Prosopis cineraria]